MVWSRLLPPAVFTGLAINTLFSPPSSMGFNRMKGKATFRVLAISTWCGTLCFFFSLVKSLCSSWSTVFCFKFQDWKWPDKFIKKKITFPSQSAPGPSWYGYEFGRSGNYTLLNRGITASCLNRGLPQDWNKMQDLKVRSLCWRIALRTKTSEPQLCFSVIASPARSWVSMRMVTLLYLTVTHKTVCNKQ